MSATNYRAYFGLKTDPFATDISTKDLLWLPGMYGVKDRFDYVCNLWGNLVVTGEVGSGKSTSLRWSLSSHPPGEAQWINVVANTGSFSELLRLIAWGLDLAPSSGSKARLMTGVKDAVRDIALSKKQKVSLIIDEANLLRVEVLAELHTLLNFDHDSRSLLSMTLCGQSNLLDRLAYRGAAPLASRVIARAHLETLNSAMMQDYVEHHVKIAGGKKTLFDQTAITAIHQGSGGILRKANSLARGGLVAAMREQKDTVSAEHIRIAASELI